MLGAGIFTALSNLLGIAAIRDHQHRDRLDLAALASAFLAMPAWMLASRVYGALTWLQFTLLRRFFLRRRPARVELLARAYDSAAKTATTRALSAGDGMWTAGVAAAAIASLLHHEQLEPGVRCVDECLTLRAVLERMHCIDPSCVELSTNREAN